MPIYEYKCLGCGSYFEKRQAVSEDALTVCEKCGGKLEKQVSLSGFQFKGAGWYVTDYAGKKPSTSESGKSSAGESTPQAESASKGSDDASAKPKTDSASKSD